MLLNCGIREDSWEFHELQGAPTSSSWRKSVLNIHWKDWCWSWNSVTLATWFEELTHLKRPWCWERLKAGGEGDDRGWDGWVVPLTQWTWVWASSGSWWWTGKSGILQSMGSQKVGHDWATVLNWTDRYFVFHLRSHAAGKPSCSWVDMQNMCVYIYIYIYIYVQYNTSNLPILIERISIIFTSSGFGHSSLILVLMWMIKFYSIVLRSVLRLKPCPTLC